MIQFSDSIGNISSSQLGIYVACILLSASISSLCSGHVADVISRKYGILAGGLIVAVGTTISASANNFPALICARLITGVGQGQSISVVTIYLCEIAPRDIRGTVATMLQLLITIGIAAGYFIAYGSSRLDSSLAWRIPFIVEACVAAMLSIGMAFMPFSPRWLVQRGRFQEASDVLLRLRQADNVDEEMYSIGGSLEEESAHQATFSEVFSKRYIRRSLLGIFLMGFQMLCGVCVCFCRIHRNLLHLHPPRCVLCLNQIDAVLYYAPILFTQAGFSSQRASFLASGISGIINLVFTIPAQLLVDKWGRKPPLIWGGIAIASCFLAIGSIYAAHGGKANGEIYLNGKQSQWAVVILIYIFVANFAWSWAVVSSRDSPLIHGARIPVNKVIKIYACEIVPTRLRAKACAFQQVSCRFSLSI